jgi:transposase
MGSSQEERLTGPVVPHDQWYDFFAHAARMGLTKSEAAARLGMSRSYSCHWIACCAPDLLLFFRDNERAKRQRILSVRVPQVAHWELSGVTNTEMAKRLGMSKSTMHNWRTRHRKRLDQYKEHYTCSLQSSSSDPRSSTS